MRGLKTEIILGAGASYCYENGRSNIPAQADIIGRLFSGIQMSGNIRMGGFIGPSGLAYSQPLSDYLRAKFLIAEDSSKAFSKADYWAVLQRRGYTLETLYADLEKDPSCSKNLLEDFEAIVRTAVTDPIPRTSTSVCKYHANLFEALEPGDYVIRYLRFFPSRTHLFWSGMQDCPNMEGNADTWPGTKWNFIPGGKTSVKNTHRKGLVGGGLAQIIAALPYDTLSNSPVK